MSSARDRHLELAEIWKEWGAAPDGSADAVPAVIPPLEPEEAIAAAKRLLRFGGVRIGRRKFVLTSGRRDTWGYGKEFRVNPQNGWRDLVHLVSHYVFMRKHPELRPHDRRHATAEARMIREVIRRGWLDGSLRRELRERSMTLVRARGRVFLLNLEIETLEQRAKDWTSKAKRAATALKKLAMRIKYRRQKLAALERCEQ